MNIPLNVLIDAVDKMKMLREVADEHLKGEQWIEALRAWSALKAFTQEISQQVKVEVTE